VIHQKKARVINQRQIRFSKKRRVLCRVSAVTEPTKAGAAVAMAEVLAVVQGGANVNHAQPVKACLHWPSKGRILWRVKPFFAIMRVQLKQTMDKMLQPMLPKR